MRVAFGIGAITAISVMGAGFVRPSWSVTDASVADAVDQTGQTAQVGGATSVQVNHVIRYVKLKPGQKAPAGAKVINAADPAPRIVVTHVAAQAPARQRQPVVKTKTKQSGKP